jgi:hypothetical protein
VARWRRSGVSAAQFAEGEDLSVTTLRWWSSVLGRDTRAGHGTTAIEPIEIAVVPSAPKGMASSVEVAIGEAVVRCEIGADVEYIAALVRALGRR